MSDPDAGQHNLENQQPFVCSPAIGGMLTGLGTSDRVRLRLPGHQNAGVGRTARCWRSIEHPKGYARSRDAGHRPARAAFHKSGRNSPGDVVIWYETSLVPAGQYETVCSGVPFPGMAKAAGRASVSDTSTARGRLNGLDEGMP